MHKLQTSQYEIMMRKFSESHKESRKDISLEIPRVHRSPKQFPTGSRYEGTWDLLGMSGYGIYTFSNGVKYEGQFDDGMFNGQGQLRYPSGVIVRGKWKRGHMIHKKLIFSDGLEYNDPGGNYCQRPDRRFLIEHRKGLQPTGRSYFTAEQPTRAVPPGYYDTGDGFYDSKTKVVYRSDDLKTVIRYPSKQEQKWIIKNCRSLMETPIGPCLDLYENWFESGIKSDRSYSASFTSAEVLTQTKDLTGILSPFNRSRNSMVRWHNQPLIRYDDLY